MDFIKGVTFGFMSRRGDWEEDESFESLRLLKERCAIDHVILAVVVEQPTIHATEIEWQADSVLSDREVIGMIAYAHELGLKVILKPMLNVWRSPVGT